MKIRFTQFLAATMAAMTVASCSNEEQLSTQPDLTPGSARITFNMGGGQTTTRGALTDGGLIKDVEVKLFKKVDGAEITGITQTLTGTTVTVTVPAGKFTPGDEVEWRLAANTTGYTKTEGASGTDLENEDASTIVGNLPKESEVQDAGKPGLPAYFKYAMTLQANVNTAQVSAMNRIPARVIVERTSGATKPITGYTIESINAATGADFYTGAANSSTQNGSFEFTVAKNEADVIGYFYPAKTAVTLSISNGGTTPKTVTFTPVKNKSYKLMITPSKDDASQDFEVSINPWDSDESLGDVDFGKTTLKVKTGATLAAGLTAGTDGELIVSAEGFDGAIDFANSFGADYTLDGVVGVTRALSGVYQISQDGMFAVGDETTGSLDIKARVNFGADKKYPVQLSVSKNGKSEECTLEVVVKGLNLPANFTTTINGVELMSVGMGESLAKTIETVNNINKEQGADFAARAQAYAAGGTAKKQEVYGKYYDHNTESCPKGFRKPTLAEANAVFGGGLPEKDKTINLTEGNNTLGGSTQLTYSGSKKEVLLTDADGNRWYIPMVTYQGSDIVWNMLTSDKETAAKHWRVVLYNKEFQLKSNTTNGVVDSCFRCVKVEQEPYTNN